MPFPGRRFHGIAGPLAAAFLCLMLVACGSDSGTSSGITATATASGAPTVGELADRIAKAWQTVGTYRTSFSSVVQATGSPAAGNEAIVIDEVQLPGRKRRVYESAGGTTAELIVVDGKIYARGPLVPGVVDTANPESWLAIDPAAFAIGSVPRRLYDSLLQPITPPYSGLDPQVRARSAVPLGPIDVQGQRCDGYRIADTTNTGDRIFVVIALGAHDLPCAIETIVAGTDNLQLFAYEVPVEIVAPTNATPAVVATPTP